VTRVTGLVTEKAGARKVTRCGSFGYAKPYCTEVLARRLHNVRMMYVEETTTAGTAVAPSAVAIGTVGLPTSVATARVSGLSGRHQGAGRNPAGASSPVARSSIPPARPHVKNEEPSGYPILSTEGDRLKVKAGDKAVEIAKSKVERRVEANTRGGGVWRWG